MKEFQAVFVVSIVPIMEAHRISILPELDCPSFMKNQLDLSIVYFLNKNH